MIPSPTRTSWLGVDWLSDAASAVVSAALLAAVLAAFAATTRSFHLTDALVFLATEGWVYALPAAGLTIVMAAGRMDLSGAAVGALAAAVAASLALAGVPLLLGFVAAALAAAVLGAAGGVVASVSRPASFVATLTTAAVAQAAAGVVVGGGGAALRTGSGGLTPLLVPGIMLAVLGCALAVIGLVSPGGAWLRRLGAERAEAPARPALVVTMVVAYAASAVLAAGGGVLELARTGAALPAVSPARQLAIILAAVLGGASLRGGRGMGYGAVVGALAVAALVHGLDARGAGSLGVVAALALALTGGVLLDELRARALARR